MRAILPRGSLAALLLPFVAVGCVASHKPAGDETAFSRDAGRDAEPRFDTPDPGDGGTIAVVDDAGTSAPDATAPIGECETHQDCVLIDRGCCAACPPAPKESVLAVPEARAEELRRAQCASPVSCGSCPPANYDPLADRVVAACIEGACTTLDLREEELTRCSDDDDCVVRGEGCCAACAAQPSSAIAIRADADDALLACDPAPPCNTCRPAALEAFCASDGHCAVKGDGLRDGELSGTCYSPSQNLIRAYEDDAVGCDCAPQPGTECSNDPQGNAVALRCRGGQWLTVDDSSCGARARR
jgi:hypothetical protein